MAWTAFPTWVIGQVSTASDWNTYVTANLNFLATPPYLYVYRNGAASLTTGGLHTTLYDTVITDTVSGFNTGTAIYTVQVAGTYLVNVALACTGAADTAWLNLAVYHNGAQWSQYDGSVNGGSTFGVEGWQYQDLVSPCAVSDTLNGAYQSSGAYSVQTTSTYSYMQILKVSN